MCLSSCFYFIELQFTSINNLKSIRKIIKSSYYPASPLFLILRVACKLISYPCMRQLRNAEVVHSISIFIFRTCTATDVRNMSPSLRKYWFFLYHTLQWKYKRSYQKTNFQLKKNHSSSFSRETSNSKSKPNSGFSPCLLSDVTQWWEFIVYMQASVLF